jgi:hypothetical protein
MTRLLLTGVAALFLATGTAHAVDGCFQLPPRERAYCMEGHPTREEARLIARCSLDLQVDKYDECIARQFSRRKKRK